MPKAATATTTLFGFSFLVSATYVLTRALAVSLFLARIGPEALPGALAVAASLAIGVSLATRRLMGRRSTARYASVTWGLLAVATGGLAIAVGPFHHSIWVLGGLYVLAEIRSALGTIYVVSLASEAFAGSESTHPLAVVSSGAPAAGIVVGLVLGFEASIAQAGVILLLTALLDAVTALLIWWGRSRLAGIGASPQADAQQVEPVVPKASARTYRFDLSSLVGLKIVALTLISFQWKVAAAGHYGQDETALIAYFAFFYAFSDILIVLIQWLVSGRLLDRFGLRLALFGFPALAALVGIAVFLAPSALAMFAVLTVANGLNVLRRSVHDPALTAAYAVLHPEIRRETIVWIKGVIKPFAEALTGVALLVSGVLLMSRGLTAVWLGVVGLWFFFAVRATRVYSAAAHAESPEADSTTGGAEPRQPVSRGSSTGRGS